MAKNGQKKVELSKVLYYIYSLITLTVGLVGWVGGLSWCVGLVRWVGVLVDWIGGLGWWIRLVG